MTSRLNQFENRLTGQCALGANKVSFMQINKMREDVAACGWKERRRGLGVDCLGKCRCGIGGLGKAFQDCALAGLAVGDQLGQPRGGVANGGAMAGQKHLPALGLQLGKRGHIGPHIAAGWRDQRGRPAHHMIAAEQRLAKGKAEMPREVAGRGDDGYV